MNMFLPSFKETVMQINHPFLVVIRLIRMTYVHILYINIDVVLSPFGSGSFSQSSWKLTCYFAGG